MSVIKRYKPEKGFREQDEVRSAYEQVGEFPSKSTRSWYAEVCSYFQSNEV